MLSEIIKFLLNHFQVDEHSQEHYLTHTITLLNAINILKSKLKQYIKHLVKEQKDGICMLPTGYGKSLTYKLLPIAY